LGPGNADDRSKRASVSSRLHLPGGRNASPWSRRFVFGAILVVVLLAPLWIDPLTLATIRGSSITPPPGAQDTIEPLDTRPNPTDDPSLVWTSVASDSFERTVASGWGTADQGGQWQPGGVSVPLAVSDGRASGGAPAAGLMLVTLDGTAAHNSDVIFTLTVPVAAANGDIVAGAVLRQTIAGAGYLAHIVIRADGSVSVGAEVFDAQGAHALSLPVLVPELTVSAGSALRVRAQTTGIDPATIRVRAWPATAAEPSRWQYSVVDWTGALQHDGALGVGWENVPITIDDFDASSADTGAS
jgi:hypothetical protein